MPRSRRMRDMARRRRDMRAMRDMARGRDSRNPYGSAGGYVVSRRGGMDRLMMDDMRMYRENPERYNLAEMTRQNQEIHHDPYTPYEDSRDYNYDMAMGYGYGDRESYPRYGYMPDARYDYAGSRRASQSGRKYNRDYGFHSPYMNYDFDYRGRDYASNEYYLSDEELMEWTKEMLKDVEEKDKAYFTKDNIEKKAKEMGIKYEDFTFPELYAATLMKYTDHFKTLGTANKDTYILMAKDFFEDEDSELKGSEKLAVYYDEVVCGGEK